MWTDRDLSSKDLPIMKKGFVVAVFLGVAFAAASPHHNDPAASAPAHSTQASAKSGQGESTQPRPQAASDQAITVTSGLPTSAPAAFGWLIVLACTVALMVAIATVVLTATALRG
ncbi:MAG TPA: hypothetical protein VGH38_12235 [Bryobacteraceae bacterium]